LAFNRAQSVRRTPVISHVIYAVCGLITICIITVLSISLLRGIKSGDIHDPETGARYEPTQAGEVSPGVVP